MEYSRNKLQELAMICTYQYLFYLKDDSRPTPAQILKDVTGNEIKDNDPFIKEVFMCVLKNTQELVDVINPALNKWTFERLGLIERAVLLNSLAQVKYMNQSKAVAIDVAVDLAKKYCDDEAYKFINGVLDNIL